MRRDASPAAAQVSVQFCANVTVGGLTVDFVVGWNQRRENSIESFAIALETSLSVIDMKHVNSSPGQRHHSIAVRLFLAAMGFASLSLSLKAAPFTAGNLAIYRVGDGSTTLTNTGNPVFVDEYTPTGVLVQSIAMPTVASGANRRLVASGTATSEGLMTRSADGYYLLAAGYDAPLPTTGLTGTASATVNRVVARLTANGVVDTTTALSDAATANNIRGVASTNGVDLWVSGGAGGIRYTTLGGTTSTQLSTTVTNIRTLGFFAGQLYSTSNSGTVIRLATVGTGAPITSGQTMTNLNGFPATGSPYGFFFADLDGSAGVDTLYVAWDDSGLTKYSLVGGSWTARGTIGVSADAYRGLTGVVSGGTVTLYATRKGGAGATGGGELVSIVDVSGYNGTFASTPTLLATAASNTAFRGVAFAPLSQASAPVVSTPPISSVIAFAGSTTLTVSAAGTQPLSYQWYQGLPGDTSRPVGTNNSSFTTPVLTATTSYWVRISNTAGFTDSASATITVLAAPLVGISPIDPVAAEALIPDTGTFRISRTGDTTAPLTVNYTVVGGAGQVSAGDYTPALGGSITIPAGQAYADIVITPTDNTLLRGDRALTLSLTDAFAYDLSASASATLTITDNETEVDLSRYVRVGRYDLPEPTRTIPPAANSLLAQEVSSVTYNWDTDTLFVVGDGGTSVVQISKTGALINSMTLATGSSPQGTEFYDTEGLTYIGNGKFILIEERYRQANLFTYVAGGTLTRAAVQTVKLGTTIGNIGIEGGCYDPQTGGYIFVKEMTPQSIFQTTIDFNAGTASNGSPTATSSTDLFNPVLAGLLDFSDIYVLANLPALSGKPNAGNVLILSQESGQVVNISRTGVVSSRLTIVADPGSPLTVPAMTNEGVTMDRDGFLYIVNENGGGDANHPQIWVYAPSLATNIAPTSLALANSVASIPQNTSTAGAVKLADLVITDDGLGVNSLSLSGADAAAFQITGTALFLKAGTPLVTGTTYNVTVNVDDSSVGATPDVSVNYTLQITAATGGTAQLIISEVAPWSSGSSGTLAVDWFEVTNIGTAAATISGWKVDDNSNSYGSAALLNGITTIAPGESVIFLETADLAGKSALFKTLWFGANPPANLQIGSYTGSGLGLGTAGDAVNLFDTNGTVQANVVFGASPAGPFATFDNAAGLNAATISTLSAVGINGALAAVGDANQIGSPGTIGASPLVLISVTAIDATASEAGADTGTFRISRTGSTVGPLTFSYTLATGTGRATAADYTPSLSGTATILDGQSYVDIVITPVDDALIEGDETLVLTLGDTGSYDVGSPASATITIVDNDFANAAPTALVLSGVVQSVAETPGMAVATKVADIAVIDDGQGTNTLALAGADASVFEITGGALYLKAGTVLNYAVKSSYSVTVTVDDATLGGTPDASVNFNLSVIRPVVSWRSAYFGTSSTAGLYADAADFDGDGVANLVEYALGLDPTLADAANGAAALPAPSLSETDSLLVGRLALVFSLKLPVPNDVTYTVQSTGDLNTWTDVARKTGSGVWQWLGGAESARVLVNNAAGSQEVKVGDLVPVDATNTRRMMRLQVTVAP